MTSKEYLALSTRLAQDLKAWIQASRERAAVSADDLVTLDFAADIITATTLRATHQQTEP